MRLYNLKFCHAAVFITSLILSACSGSGSMGASSTSKISIETPPANPPATTALATAGTDFYVILPDQLCLSAPAECNYKPPIHKLLIVAPAATTGEVIFNNVIRPFSVETGGQALITLAIGAERTSNELVETRSIHVTALSPVSVYVISENDASAVGYLAFPAHGLGTQYYVMAWTGNKNHAHNRQAGSVFAVVATQDETTVKIIPRVDGALKAASFAETVLLNMGETYQFANPGNSDMTGTLVTSDKPIAMFGGRRCANAPSNADYCDYMIEQLPTLSSWGNTFHTSALSDPARYTVRVIAAQDNTTFRTEPTGLIGTLNAGQFADVNLEHSAEFVSSSPVLVAQFIRGHQVVTASKNDPGMVLLTPAEMGVTDATFGVYDFTGSKGASINIVIKSDAITSLMLDNAAVDPELFSSAGGTGLYSMANLPLAPGVHTLKGTSPYSALVYDFGNPKKVVSYAYPVAAKLAATSGD